jgi:nitrate reductase gamma subunit
MRIARDAVRKERSVFMEGFGYFAGVILPPITLLFFFGGLAYRALEWRKLTMPKITLYPAPETGPDTFWGVFKATFFSPGLFKADRVLWIGAWVFHAALALILIGHVRVGMDFPALWAAAGINADIMSAVVGTTAGVIILLATLFLTYRRVALSRVKEISQAGDYFALFLLLAVILSGNAMRVQGHFDLNLTREYFSGLLRLQGPIPPLNGWFLIHFLLGQILFLYLPFSKLLHLGGIFVTQTALQRR